MGQRLCRTGAGILPGATFTSQQFVDWFEAHFARGAYDGVALLGSHALLDEQACVRSADVAGGCRAHRCHTTWQTLHCAALGAACCKLARCTRCWLVKCIAQVQKAACTPASWR
jgi:hypothetical protein